MALISQSIKSMQEEQYEREVKAVEHFISMCIVRYPFYFTTKDKKVVIKLDLDTLWPKGIVIYMNKENSDLYIDAPSLSKTAVCDILRNSGAQHVSCEQIDTLRAKIVATFMLES